MFSLFGFKIVVLHGSPKENSTFHLGTVFALLLWPACCSDIVLALNHFDGGLSFPKQSPTHRFLRVALSLDVFRYAWELGETKLKSIEQSLLGALVFATLVKIVD